MSTCRSMRSTPGAETPWRWWRSRRSASSAVARGIGPNVLGEVGHSRDRAGIVAALCGARGEARICVFARYIRHHKSVEDFEFEETEDQLRAIRAWLMMKTASDGDRLACWAISVMENRGAQRRLQSPDGWKTGSHPGANDDSGIKDYNFSPGHCLSGFGRDA